MARRVTIPQLINRLSTAPQTLSDEQISRIVEHERGMTAQLKKCADELLGREHSLLEAIKLRDRVDNEKGILSEIEILLEGRNTQSAQSILSMCDRAQIRFDDLRIRLNDDINHFSTKEKNPIMSPEQAAALVGIPVALAELAKTVYGEKTSYVIYGVIIVGAFGGILAFQRSAISSCKRVLHAISRLPDDIKHSIIITCVKDEITGASTNYALAWRASNGQVHQNRPIHSNGTSPS